MLRYFSSVSSRYLERSRTIRSSKKKIWSRYEKTSSSSEAPADQHHSTKTAEPELMSPKNTRRFTIMTTTTKGVYVHYRNDLAFWWWGKTDFNWYFWGGTALFIGSQIIHRYKVGKKISAEKVMIGENLLDERTKELLGDIEKLREKDPLRLEKEANTFHEDFWKTRALAVSDSLRRKRTIEKKQDEALTLSKGTDMSEWMEAKVKDTKEKEIARRTHEYIQGFHQYLKVRRLI